MKGARTSIRYGEEHVQVTFVAKQLGYSNETSAPIYLYTKVWAHVIG